MVNLIDDYVPPAVPLRKADSSNCWVIPKVTLTHVSTSQLMPPPYFNNKAWWVSMILAIYTPNLVHIIPLVLTEILYP